MGLLIKEIEDRKVWDDFLKSSTYKSFLQTWDWGEFQSKGLGNRINRLGFYEGKSLKAVCLAVREHSRFGDFVVCPRGPVLDWEDKELVDKVISGLVKYFDHSRVGWLRADPAILEDNVPVADVFHELGFVDAVKYLHVGRAWVLDIGDAIENELLAGMRKNTRYYIRRAEKFGVTVRISSEPKDAEIFIEMLQEMCNRKHFTARPAGYLRKEFEYMGKSGIFKILIAEKDGKPVASSMVSYYGNEASYLHAASAEDNSELQAPYLIQWESIKYAKASGLLRYNFWGVVEDRDYHSGHPGFGYSNFKRGFGGHLEVYLKTKDNPYSKVPYLLFRAQESWRKYRNKMV